MQIKLLVEGGDMKPGPVLSQKLGPVGINLNQVIQKVNEATKKFSGMKVPVELDIDMGNKEFDVNVFSPPASELLKKEISVEKGSSIHKKLYAGNASIEQIISVAKAKLPNMLSKNLKSAVKTIVGSCASIGILVENKQAVEIIKDIEQGKYDREIQEEKTETSEGKKAELDSYFKKLKEEQEKIIKQEEAAKEAEAEKVEEKPEGEEAEKPEEKVEEKAKGTEKKDKKK